MKDELVSVVASIAREKPAVTTAVRPTYEAPAAGDLEETVGGGGGLTVVKLQLTALVSGVPSTA